MVLSEINPHSDLPVLTARAGLILDTAALLGIELDLWRAQNQLIDVYAALFTTDTLGQPLRDAFAQLADKLNIDQGMLGWRP